MDNQKLPPSIIELANFVGEFIEYWGFKKTGGQVWTIIFISNKPVDANYIMDTLCISKTNVSTTINLLLSYGVIKEVEKNRPSTKKYISHPQVLNAALNVLKNRERKLVSNLKNSVSKSLSLPKEELYKYQIEPKKLERLSKIVHSSEMLINSIIKLSSFNFSGWKKIL